MKNISIKKSAKILGNALALSLILSPIFSLKTSYADTNIEDNTLQNDITERLNRLGGDWQVAINSLSGNKNINLYFTSDSCPETLPAASSIKIFIGLSVFDQIERGFIGDDSPVYDDIYNMLNISDNAAANKLVQKLDGFDGVNRTIIDITGRATSKMNRLFLHKGEENITNASDLNIALTRIYNKDYISSDNSSYMLKAMTNTSTKQQKLLGAIGDYDWAINKSGELPDRGVENDSAIIKIDDETFVITVLSRTNNIYNRKPQLDAMKDVGKIASDYFKSKNTNTDVENQIEGVYYYKKVDLDKNYLGRK